MPEYVSVSQINAYIKYRMEQDINLRKVYLKGELSNVKRDFRGHYYLTIKDNHSRINGVMFASYAKNLLSPLKDGMNVLIEGSISVFEKSGNYQIYIKNIEEDGIGKLYIEFEKLKKKLKEEGLFDLPKKPLPKYPETIGIITAPNGAAIEDILSTIKRRWPFVKTILFPSLVQGKLAKDDLVRNIKLTKDYPLDLLIIGRGGGSLEDLWPFNEEEVARSLVKLEIPIISAVGHEVDFSICDFVADLRAPTPTGAAEMAVPNIEDVLNNIKHLKKRSNQNIKFILDHKKKSLDSLISRPVIKEPFNIINTKSELLSFFHEKLLRHSHTYLTTKKEKLIQLKHSPVLKSPELLITKKRNEFEKVEILLKERIVSKKNYYNNLMGIYFSKLELLNPLSTLERGYSIARSKKIIKSIKDVKKDEVVTIEVKDGVIKSKVVNVEEKKNEI